MKIIAKIMTVALLALLPVIAGCGGGGGGTAATTPTGGSGGGTPPAPTAALLRLAAPPGTLAAGTTVAGVAATVELPPGVTVKRAADGITVDPSVVVPSGLLGGGTTVMGPVSYTAATATAKARLDFTIASTAIAGVGEGEYATITFILNGVTPAVSDFTVSSFQLTCLPLYNMLTVTAATTLTLL